MKLSYTTTFAVDQSPAAVFAAINNARGWWSGEIAGETAKLGAEFTYRVPDIHYCRIKIAELVPGRAVVWHVVDSDLSYTNARTESTGTTIRFDISRNGGKTVVRFTHVGLVPADECYDSCSDAWGTLLHRSLRALITTG